jgi:hypothetical protein
VHSPFGGGVVCETGNEWDTGIWVSLCNIL